MVVERPVPSPRLQMVAVSKSFGETTAVADVDFDVRPGEIHALLGENGAGKTTLMRMLTGYLSPDSGTLIVNGKPTAIPDPRTALDLGIGMVHQHSVLVPGLTVAENILMGRQPSWFARYSPKNRYAEIERVCERFGVDLRPNDVVTDLSTDRVQQVEIVRLLYRDVDTIVLDEPTAILGRAFVDRLFSTLNELREEGRSIVIITHKIREVMAIADRASIMRRGELVDVLEREELDEVRLAKALMVAPTMVVPAPKHTRSDRVAIQIEGLSVLGDRAEDAVNAVDLTVHKGEIVGVSGVEGNGQRELVEALSGLRPIHRGDVTFGGARGRGVNPKSLDQMRVAVISEDRQRWDIVSELSLAENLYLPTLGRSRGAFDRWGFLRRTRMETRARRVLEDYGITPAEPAFPAGNLSGGNQQKLVLARELSVNPQAVVAAHPTRGLDVAATEFVLGRLRGAASEGSGVLLISSDLDELRKVCDRIVVLFRGNLVYDTPVSELDHEMLSRAMAGAVN